MPKSAVQTRCPRLCAVFWRCRQTPCGGHLLLWMPNCGVLLHLYLPNCGGFPRLYLPNCGGFLHLSMCGTFPYGRHFPFLRYGRFPRCGALPPLMKIFCFYLLP